MTRKTIPQNSSSESSFTPSSSSSIVIAPSSSSASALPITWSQTSAEFSTKQIPPDQKKRKRASAQESESSDSMEDEADASKYKVAATPTTLEAKKKNDTLETFVIKKRLAKWEDISSTITFLVSFGDRAAEKLKIALMKKGLKKHTLKQMQAFLEPLITSAATHKHLELLKVLLDFTLIANLTRMRRKADRGDPSKCKLNLEFGYNYTCGLIAKVRTMDFSLANNLQQHIDQRFQEELQKIPGYASNQLTTFILSSRSSKLPMITDLKEEERSPIGQKSERAPELIVFSSSASPEAKKSKEEEGCAPVIMEKVEVLKRAHQALNSEVAKQHFEEQFWKYFVPQDILVEPEFKELSDNVKKIQSGYITNKILYAELSEVESLRIQLAKETQRADQEKARADREKARADREKNRADEEQKRAADKKSSLDWFQQQSDYTNKLLTQSRAEIVSLRSQVKIAEQKLTETQQQAMKELIATNREKIDSDEISLVGYAEKLIEKIQAKKIPTEEELEPVKCPISRDIMHKPVGVVGSKKIYDRTSIEDWFNISHTDPQNRKDLSHAELRVLKPLITLETKLKNLKELLETAKKESQTEVTHQENSFSPLPKRSDKEEVEQKPELPPLSSANGKQETMEQQEAPPPVSSVRFSSMFGLFFHGNSRVILENRPECEQERERERELPPP